MFWYSSILKMNKAHWQKLIRKYHRYLGVFFGVQFLFWTLGGLYFSWTNIKEIRGDNIRRAEPPLKISQSEISLSSIINKLKYNKGLDSVKSVQVVDILGISYYQIGYFNDGFVKYLLVNTNTGITKTTISKEEAILIAQSRLNVNASPSSVGLITNTNGHHEYREKPLPAYAVKFEGNIHTTVYVAANLGTVQTLRNNKWRVFDFLWMLHVMDYENRDNINNWILRIFSILGLVTIASGFILYFLTYKKSNPSSLIRR